MIHHLNNYTVNRAAVVDREWVIRVPIPWLSACRCRPPVAAQFISHPIPHSSSVSFWPQARCSPDIIWVADCSHISTVTFYLHFSAAFRPAQHRRRAWSEDERAAALRHLGVFLERYEVPGKKDWISCIENENALRSPTWRDDKYFIHNRTESNSCWWWTVTFMLAIIVTILVIIHVDYEQLCLCNSHS